MDILGKDDDHVIQGASLAHSILDMNEPLLDKDKILTTVCEIIQDHIHTHDPKEEDQAVENDVLVVDSILFDFNPDNAYNTDKDQYIVPLQKGIAQVNPGSIDNASTPVELSMKSDNDPDFDIPILELVDRERESRNDQVEDLSSNDDDTSVTSTTKPTSSFSEIINNILSFMSTSLTDSNSSIQDIYHAKFDRVFTQIRPCKTEG